MKCFILAFFMLSTSNYCFAQKPDFLKNDGMKTELQKKYREDFPHRAKNSHKPAQGLA